MDWKYNTVGRNAIRILILIEPVVRLAKYLTFRVADSLFKANVMHNVRKLAMEDSAKFIGENLQDANLFDSRERLWDFALAKVQIPGMHLEFGVHDGYSINYFAKKKPHQVFIGFDSFEGLAEDWHGTSLLEGAFDLGGQLPVVPSNVRLVSGWFSETLPDFVQTKQENIAYVHLDADTYQATTCVLSFLGSRLVNGSILVLD